MKKCEHDLIEDECFQCLRALVKEQDETIKENMRAMSAGIRYRDALEALYEAANTKDRVSLEDLEAAYDALNR